MSETGNVEGAGDGGRPVEGFGHVQKLAEWVTLGVSVVIVAAAAGYMVYLAVRDSPRHVPADATLRLGEARQAQGRYVLPVEARNRGRRTLRDFQAELRYTPPGGQPEKREFKLDYLAAGATQTVYFYFDRPPAELNLEVSPQSYRLE